MFNQFNQFYIDWKGLARLTTFLTKRTRRCEPHNLLVYLLGRLPTLRLLVGVAQQWKILGKLGNGCLSCTSFSKVNVISHRVQPHGMVPGAR